MIDKNYHVLKVLERYTDEKHYINCEQIANKISEQTGVKLNRKTILSAIKCINDEGEYCIEKCSKGFYLDERKIPVENLTILIRSLKANYELSAETKISIIDNLLLEYSDYQKEEIKTWIIGSLHDKNRTKINSQDLLKYLYDKLKHKSFAKIKCDEKTKIILPTKIFEQNDALVLECYSNDGDEINKEIIPINESLSVIKGNFDTDRFGKEPRFYVRYIRNFQEMNNENDCYSYSIDRKNTFGFIPANIFKHNVVKQENSPLLYIENSMPYYSYSNYHLNDEDLKMAIDELISNYCLTSGEMRKKGNKTSEDISQIYTLLKSFYNIPSLDIFNILELITDFSTYIPFSELILDEKRYNPFLVIISWILKYKSNELIESSDEYNSGLIDILLIILNCIIKNKKMYFTWFKYYFLQKDFYFDNKDEDIINGLLQKLEDVSATTDLFKNQNEWGSFTLKALKSNHTRLMEFCLKYNLKHYFPILSSKINISIFDKLIQRLTLQNKDIIHDINGILKESNFYFHISDTEDINAAISKLNAYINISKNKIVTLDDIKKIASI